MTRVWKTVVILVGLFSALLSLCGCKMHMVDGPGMVNRQTWTRLEITHSESFAQGIYWFTVEEREEGFFLTGSCRDEDGNYYENEDGIYLPPAFMNKLWDMELAELPDVPPASPEENDFVDEELIVLDMGSSSLSLVTIDGKTYKKSASEETFLTLYNLFVPRFAKAAK